MAYVNWCGFETGDSLEAGTASGTWSVQNSVKRSGDWALRTNPTTTGTGYFYFQKYGATGSATTSFGANNIRVRFYLRIATLPGSNDECFAAFNSSTTASAHKLELRLNSSGNILAYNAAGTLVATGTTVLSTSTWYMIEAQCGTSATTGTYTVRINGVQEFTGTTNTSATQNNAFFLGKVQNRNSQSVDFYYDDLLIQDDITAWPGAGKVLRMEPDGDGNYTAWTGDYTAVDDLAAGSASHDGDSTVITSNTASQAETCTMESASSAGIQSYDTVVGVKALTVAKDSSGTSAYQTRLRSGTTDSDTTSANITSTYFGNGKILTTDPATGAAWTVSALDSIEVGGVNGTAAVTTSVTAVCAMVATLDGTPPGGGLLLRGLGS